MDKSSSDSIAKDTYHSIDSEENLSQNLVETSRRAAKWRRACIALSCFLGLALVALAGTTWRAITLPACKNESQLKGLSVPYSPASGHVGYVNKHLTRDPQTRLFMSKPRPEVDEAWHELLSGTLIRVTGKELEAAGNATSVAHNDGGYVAGLGVSHTLHCVKRIKQYLYPDYYYPKEDTDWEELGFHVEHCLEALRQMAMCKADLGLYTLEFTNHSRVKPTVRVPQAHVCVDWPKLHAWMQSRAARNEDMVRPGDASESNGHE